MDGHVAWSARVRARIASPLGRGPRPGAPAVADFGLYAAPIVAGFHHMMAHRRTARWAPLAWAVIVGLACGLPGPAVAQLQGFTEELVAKEVVEFPAFGSVRLVLRLRPPQEKFVPGRVAALAARSAAWSGDPPPSPAEATHAVYVDANFVDPKLWTVPGEHISYLAVTLTAQPEGPGPPVTARLVPVMDPFYHYGALLKLPRPGRYRLRLMLVPEPIIGLRNPTPVEREYPYTWAGPGAKAR